MHAHASAFGCAHVQENFQKQLAKLMRIAASTVLKSPNTSYSGCLCVGVGVGVGVSIGGGVSVGVGRGWRGCTLTLLQLSSAPFLSPIPLYRYTDLSLYASGGFSPRLSCTARAQRHHLPLLAPARPSPSLISSKQIFCLRCAQSYLTTPSVMYNNSTPREWANV
jgi:hypothetical protein